MSRQITICECAARDGLQHEVAFVATDAKVSLIDSFTELGFRRIEATSFSHPKHVPQFADAEDVLKRIIRRAGVSYKATCVNDRAVERAIQAVVDGAGPSEISMVVSASEAHQVRNTRRTHAEVRSGFERMVEAAQESGLRIVGTIGTAFGCPFSGEVPLAEVEHWTAFFSDMGIDMITLGDTTGMADPEFVRERFGALLNRFPDIVWVGHFHDTRGTGLANALAAVEAGVDYLDSSFGGLGGHPAAIKYAEGHTGNVVTEDLVAVLQQMGYDTGIDMDRLIETAEGVEKTLGRELHGRVTRSGLVTRRID
ncbi:hydroxymethylglutaryl-CoA lyase [Nitratireductor mangrovi]|uniref:Hydroxymethylglutaryl-CoA lyase n=1 Tax=Nitratireductor mangrovi TaxID=2599600 RepID=A0A5B8L166_9HYPH|nr:hydroxymethylglutaryl-CoA lyase [Nitratireductor mangrovi]QDZ01318.1 hydroxymethylglutaryl-CoA lyase [Nitratireductor mangrovi]